MPTHPSADAWFKSSYSDGQGTNCVEAAHLTPAPGIAVRDSKNPAGRALHLAPATWTAFVAHLRGEGPTWA